MDQNPLEAPGQSPQGAPAPSEVQPTVQQTNNKSSIALIAMILGLVALITVWVPFVGFGVAIAAIIFGIVALARGFKKGFAVTGLATGGVALITSLIFTALFIGTAMNPSVDVKPSSESSTSAHEKPVAIEDQEVLGWWQVRVNSVEKDIAVEGKPDGVKYLAVNLTVRNVSAKSDRFLGLDYTLNAASYTSKKHPDSGTFSGRIQRDLTLDPALVDGQSIPRGETATGYVIFEQPPEGTPLNLLFAYVRPDENNPGKYVPAEKVFDLNDYMK